MVSNISVVVVFGLLCVAVTVVVQSAPLQAANNHESDVSLTPKQQTFKQLFLGKFNPVKPVTPTTTTTVSTLMDSIPESSDSASNKKTDDKKKRSLDDFSQFGDIFHGDDDVENGQPINDDDDEIDSYQQPYFKFDQNNGFDPTLHALTKETSATVHDMTNKPTNTDDSVVFSDVKMTPNELTDIVRQRRDINLNDGSNRRHKRSLSAYDLFDNDPLYNPLDDLIEQEEYVRPSRAFAPLFWYPSAYERNIRSALLYPYYNKATELEDLYPDNQVDNDDIDDNQVPLFDDENDAENDYELNRYPILSQTVSSPFDNLQLQQQYNTDDLQTNDDDDDGLIFDDDSESLAQLFPYNDENVGDEVEQLAQQYNNYYRPSPAYF